LCQRLDSASEIACRILVGSRVASSIRGMVILQVSEIAWEFSLWVALLAAGQSNPSPRSRVATIFPPTTCHDKPDANIVPVSFKREVSPDFCRIPGHQAQNLCTAPKLFGV